MAATNTPNYNLIKPGVEDFYDVTQFNQNAEIIDAALKELQQSSTHDLGYRGTAVDEAAGIGPTKDISNYPLGYSYFYTDTADWGIFLNMQGFNTLVDILMIETVKTEFENTITAVQKITRYKRAENNQTEVVSLYKRSWLTEDSYNGWSNALELVNRKDLTALDSKVNEHLADKENPHDVTAKQVPIRDAGAYYTATDVEAALQETGADVATINGALSTLTTNFNNHNNDTTRHIQATERTKWNNKLNVQVSYMTGGVAIDPNTTADPAVLTNHANGPRGGGEYWYIITVFYNGISNTANRAQIAIRYNGFPEIATRFYYNPSWSPWRVFGSQTTVSATAPANPQNGDVWIQI